MATPVMTPSDPSQYRDQLNKILYSKNQFAKAQTDGNQGLMTWAQSQAAPAYGQLPTDLRSQVQGMNAAALQSFYQSLFNAPQPGAGGQPAPAQPPSTLVPQASPFDQQLTDLLGQLTGAVNNPAPNPFDAQMAALLQQLTGLINSPLPTVQSTPQFTAAQERLGRQQADQVNLASEQLGGSGLARSSIVTDRAQGIAQEFTDYMETQIIPAIAQQLQGERQLEVSNLGQLLGATGDQQSVFDERSKSKLQGLATLYDALTGQQGRFDELMQNEFSNRIAQGGLDLDKEKFTQQKKMDEITAELAQIDSALARTQTMGAVSQADAAVLGVPAGTPSFQAANAVAQRKHELQIQREDNAAAMARTNAQIGASWKETQARISADAEQNRLNREEANKGEDYRLLLSLWETQGTAPKGLEKFGVKAGTPLGQGSISPQEALAQIQLDQAKADQTHQKYVDTNAPSVQKQYGANKVTAEAILNVLDNPNSQSALAELNSTSNQLTQLGVDVGKVKKAIGDFYAKKVSSSEANKQYDASGTSKKYPRDQWVKWYNDDRGRLSNVDFPTWRKQYGSQSTLTSREAAGLK